VLNYFRISDQALIVPIENVRFLNPAPQQTLHRVTRSAWPQEEQQQQFVFSPNAASPQFSQRRQGEGSSPFEIPQNIRAAEDAIAAGSSPSSYKGNAGPDYVDYGAYTGGYGAFGWYTDHPVLIQTGQAYHH
jgi:hypothetical protein